LRTGAWRNTVPDVGNAVPDVVVPAVEETVAARTLRERSDTYAGEIRRLLDATYAVMRRTGELDPRVSDIVAESGLSNQAFYRHFQSKDELLVAVLADGQRRLVATLDERMRAASPGQERVRAWVEVVLAQARRPAAAANTRPFAINGLRLADRYPAEWDASRDELLAPLRAAIDEAGGDAEDAELVYHLAMGTMQVALVRRQPPTDTEVARVVDAVRRVIIRTASP
jgi:AcrR family transcriptional regulator